MWKTSINVTRGSTRVRGGVLGCIIIFVRERQDKRLSSHFSICEDGCAWRPCAKPEKKILRRHIICFSKWSEAERHTSKEPPAKSGNFWGKLPTIFETKKTIINACLRHFQKSYLRSTCPWPWLLKLSLIAFVVLSFSQRLKEKTG